LLGNRGEFNEQAVKGANWAMVEFGAAMNAAGIGIHEARITSEQLALIVARIIDGTINHKTAKDVFSAVWAGEGSAAGDDAADAVIEARGLKQISDVGAIEKLIDEVLVANAKSVEEFRAGKEKAFNALVGQAMKATKGKANPAQVNGILRRKLG
jgi:aspartyl-tRNA(Asn)/glutamyl-tRNA(Gln) amidotransferase subunit B